MKVTCTYTYTVDASCNTLLQWLFKTYAEYRITALHIDVDIPHYKLVFFTSVGLMALAQG